MSPEADPPGVQEPAHSLSHDATAAGALSLRGGELCIDYVNTVSSRGQDHESDFLETYADLVAWSEHAGGIDGDTAARLRALAARDPDAAAGALRRARLLREAVYRIFHAQATGQAAAEADLELLNAEVSQAMAQLRLRPHNDHYHWEWASSDPAPERPLWPIARSAAELLTSGELAYVRKCAADACGWLFVDRTKNHSRRWCDMKDCGNVAKVRRYRSRHKEAPE